MHEITSLNQLLSLVRDRDVVVVKFYADWCGPCRRVAPEYARLSSLYDASRVTFAKCNIDRNSDCAGRYNVRGVPTFIVWVGSDVMTTVSGGDMGALQRAIDIVLPTRPPPPSVPSVPSVASVPSQSSSSHPPSSSLPGALAEHMSAIARAGGDAAARQSACAAVRAELSRDAAHRPFGAALLPYFASDAFRVGAVDAFVSSLANDEAMALVNALLRQAMELLLASTWDRVRELDALRRALLAMVSCASSVLPLLARSPYLDSNVFASGEQIEYGTVLGALLGVGPRARSHRPNTSLAQSEEWRHVLAVFPPDFNNNDDNSSIRAQRIAEIQSCMESACVANARVVIALLQAKVSREPTLRFMGTALRLNAGYSKTMHQTLPLSSRYFMAQLNDVLVEVTLPLLGKSFDPLTIPTSYVLASPGDPAVVVDYGKDVERVTHYDEDRPLPTFTAPAEPFRPSAHLFFLAARATTLAAAVFIEVHEREERESSLPRIQPQQRAALVADKCLLEGLFASKTLARRRVQLLNGIALWLVRVMGVLPDGSLPAVPPPEWEYLPQQLVDIVIRGVQLAPLEYYNVENIIALMLVLMGNTTYFPKPHTHALFPSFLARLIEDPETKQALVTHPWFSQHIVRACVLCYIAVEKSTYEKVNVRYTLSHCIKSFLVFDSLCQPVREEFETDGTVLERFSHMVTADVNEAVDQLIETLSKMNQMMKNGADLSDNPRNEGVPQRSQQDAPAQQQQQQQGGGRRERERGRGGQGNDSQEDDSEEPDDEEGEPTYHQLGLSLRQYILLFEASIDLFIQLSISFSRGVTQNMVAQQISQMLARSLTSFAGAESRNLKIEHPERYSFRPRDILSRLVNCLTQFCRFQNFLRCLCNCGVPLRDILQSINTITARRLVDENLMSKLREMASTLETMSEKVNEDEALWDDAPEYALDALLSTPLLHPVALPAEVKDVADLVYVNEDTIHHVLLSENKHPFTKEYLDEKMVKEFNLREDVARARQELQRNINKWLLDAKQKRGS